jgi:acyl carrier protein
VRKKLHSRKAPSRQLVAFYTSRNDELTRSALAAQMKSIPFEANVPLVFQQVEILSRKPDGTIEWEQLQGAGNSNEGDRTWTAPQGEVESQLLEVWKKVLEVERVGVHDKFFELGGNSLKSLRLLAAVNQRFSCQVAVVDLFKFSTVKTLSSHIEKITSQGNGKGESRISGFEF